MKEKETSSSQRLNSTSPGGHLTLWERIRIGLDWPLFIATIALIILGLVMVFSATTAIGVNGEVTDPVGHFGIQVLSVFIGIVMGIIIFMLPDNLLREYKAIMFALMVIIFFLVLVFFFGVEAGGAKSWLRIGFASFQPSEFIKIIAILAVSWMLVLTERIPNLTKDKYKFNDMRMMLFLIVLALGFIVIQSDFGMTLIIIMTCLLMFSLSKWSVKINLMGLIAALAVISLNRLFIQIFFGNASEGRHYIINRFISYVNPYAYAESFGFQLIQGYQAIVNGGLFGRGLGQSLMKHEGRLPARENDFILAILVEEFGVIGGIAVLGLFFFVISRLIWWSMNSTDSYRSKVLLGIGILLFIQVCVNIGGMLGLIPLSGVTLPFISEGGSSMLMYMVTLAVGLRAIMEEKIHQAMTQEEESYDI